MTQLDLFGLSAEQQRRVDALTCLRDSVPTALEVVVDLRYTDPHDTRSPCATGNWAYCVSKAGVRFETTHEWWYEAHARGERSGWDRTPANLLRWDELAALVGDDPRRAEVAGWVGTLAEPRWKLLRRPFELEPDGDGFHIRYFCRDHVDPHWTQRRRCWQLVRDLLNDAIDSVAVAS